MAEMFPKGQRQKPGSSDNPSAGFDDAIVTLGPSGGTDRPVDMEGAVRAAFELVGSPSVATVLVNDPHRQTATRSVLELFAKRIAPANLRILIATGTHQVSPTERREFEGYLTDGIPVGMVEWHDSRRSDLVDIAGMWRGNRLLVEDYPVLAIGSVEPHYFAGFTGAHKTATIGCAGYEDIEKNHSAALSSQSRPGELGGNPVHAGIVKMLRSLQNVQRLAGINLVQSGREVLFAAGGDVISSLEASCKVAADIYCHQIDSPADVLILEVTGALGRSFYQADKGIKNNEWALRDGGVLILQAPCPEGLGQDQFVSLLGEGDNYDEVVRIVAARGYRLGDHKAVRCRYLTDPLCRGVKVFIVSEGISSNDARVLGMKKVADVGEALSLSKIDPSKHRVYRVGDAGNCCVSVRGRETSRASCPDVPR